MTLRDHVIVQGLVGSTDRRQVGVPVLDLLIIPLLLLLSKERSSGLELEFIKKTPESNQNQIISLYEYFAIICITDML